MPGQNSAASGASSAMEIEEPAAAIVKYSKLAASTKQQITKRLDRFRELMVYFDKENQDNSVFKWEAASAVVDCWKSLQQKERTLEDLTEKLNDFYQLDCNNTIEAKKAADAKQEDCYKALTTYRGSIKKAQEETDTLLKTAMKVVASHTDAEEAQPQAAVQATQNRANPFRPRQELLPLPLQADSSFREVMDFAERLENFMISGSSSGAIEAVHLHPQLMVSLSEDWRDSLRERGLTKNTGFSLFKDILVEEARARSPIHVRRLAFFKMPKSDTPVATLRALQNASTTIDWESLSLSAFICHLFIDKVKDNRAIEIATEHLRANPDGNIRLLTDKLQQEENLRIIQGKPQVIPKERGKKVEKQVSCSNCGRTNHTLENCRVCTFCRKFGHTEKGCYKKQQENREEDAKKTGMPGKNKKNKKKAKAAGIPEDLNSSTASSASSESTAQGKSIKIKTRKALALHSASSLPDSLDSLESAPESPVFRVKTARIKQNEEEITEACAHQIRDAVIRMKVLKKKAKKAQDDNPLQHCQIAGRSWSSAGLQTFFLADSGASVSILPATTARKAGIKIIPVKGKLDIVTAAGENVKCLGKANFFIKTKALGNSARMVRAFIIDTADDEILLGMPELKRFSYLHPTFPHQTFADYLSDVCNNNKVINAYPRVLRGGENIKHLHTQSESKLEKQCRKLKAVLLNEYADTFKSKLGPDDVMKIPPVTLEIDKTKNIRPFHASTSYQIPHHLKIPARDEWDEMIKSGVIEKSTKSSEWTSQAFPVIKPNANPVACRWVSSFVHLNRALKRPTFGTANLPNLIRSIPSDARLFVSIDLKSGFHQIAVDEESRQLLTIISEYGRYRYTRLAQGICSATDIFNMYTSGCTDLNHKDFYLFKNVDDCLLAARDLSHLEWQIRRLLDWCRKMNLKLNKSKFNLGPSVVFGGVEISSQKMEEGSTVFIDPEKGKIRALIDFPKPKDKKSVQRFCGMIAHLQSWYPTAAFDCKNLRKSCSGNSKFEWNDILNEEFELVKQQIIKKVRLVPYCPKKRLFLQTDASGRGLAYVLFQYCVDHDPSKGVNIISCNSTGITESQSRFSPVELESLAVLYAARSTAFWLIGCPEINLITDCSALKELMQKCISEIENPRLQKIISRCNFFNWKVSHVKGTDNNFIDTLSRANRQVLEAPAINTWDPRLGSISSNKKIATAQLSIIDPWVQRIAEVASEDMSYLQMVNDLNTKKPHKHFESNSELAKMKSELNNLSTKIISDGNVIILRRGTEILVPKAQRREILDLAHENHHCPQFTHLQLKNRVFWPGMRADIEEYVKNCEGCKKHARSQPMAKQNVDFSSIMFNVHPGDILYADLAQMGGKTFITLVDKISGYTYAQILRNQTAKEAARAVNEYCQLISRPLQVRSDMGPSFRSEFKKSLEKLKINHEYSSSYNPASNANAERSVQAIKSFLLKNAYCLNQENLMRATSTINKSRTAEGTGSPNDKFFGRPTRTHIPNSLDVNLNPSDLIRKRAMKQYDRLMKKGRSTFRKYNIGQKVLIQNQNSKLWETSAIIHEERISDDGYSWSYVLETESGQKLIRNQKYIKPETCDMN